MRKAGLDIGFGWTKVWTEEKRFKFPSWLALWQGYSISDVEPIEYEGRQYVVGDLAVYSGMRIELSDFETLVRFLPVFVEHVKRELGEKELTFVGGLAPKHYKELTQEQKNRLSRYFERIVPQGVGVLVDVFGVEPELSLGEEVVVFDVGFNTVDFLVAKWNGGSYKKVAMDTIERLGVLRAVESFKAKLPERVVGIASNFSPSRLVKVFEDGFIKIEGEKVDLTPYKERSKEEYRDVFLTRIREVLGEGVFSADKVIVAGGGAYLVSDIRKDAIVPDMPEYSNARGYAKL